MSSSGALVLVVDDEIAIRRFLRVALSGEGFSVSEVPLAGSPAGLTREHPDLVILDLGLPDLSGLEITNGCVNDANSVIILLGARSGTGKRSLPWMPERTIISPNRLAWVNCWRVCGQH